MLKAIVFLIIAVILACVAFVVLTTNVLADTGVQVMPDGTSYTYNIDTSPPSPEWARMLATGEQYDYDNHVFLPPDPNALQENDDPVVVTDPPVTFAEWLLVAFQTWR